jgi:hypothetical protein
MSRRTKEGGREVFRLCREIGHSGRVPRGWRMAWYEPRRRLGVYCLAPFHWLARVWREVVCRVQLAWRAPSIELAEIFAMQREHRRRQDLADEFARGYMQGWHECFETCLGVVEEELTTSSEWDASAFLLPNVSKPETPN